MSLADPKLESLQKILEKAEEEIRIQASENDSLRSQVRVMEWHLENGGSGGGKRESIQNSDHQPAKNTEQSPPLTPRSQSRHLMSTFETRGDSRLLGGTGRDGMEVRIETVRRAWMEDELHLRDRQLASAQARESQLVAEIRSMERRLSEMRIAYDDQQRSMLEATEKSLEYRKEVLEKNVELSRALESAERDKAVFVSSLLPIVGEFGLHPNRENAEEIVQSLKMTMRHLLSAISLERRIPLGPRSSQEASSSLMGLLSGSDPAAGVGTGLIVEGNSSASTSTTSTSASLKQSMFIPGPSMASEPALASFGDAAAASRSFKESSSQRQQPQQQHGNRADPPSVMSPQAPQQQPSFSTVVTHTALAPATVTAPAQSGAPAPGVMSSPPTPSSPAPPPRGPSWTQVVRTVQEVEAEEGTQPPFASNEAGPLAGAAAQEQHEDSRQQASAAGPSSTHPYSSPAPASESALAMESRKPGIEGLRIVGDAVLGAKLTACGHSVNGTSLCIFQWVREYNGGEREYIEGAASPEYVVSADDCGCTVAIECVPMDAAGNRGDVVNVAANEGDIILPDSMMQEKLRVFLAEGVASFEVHLMQDDNGEEGYESRGSPCVLHVRRNDFALKKGSRKIMKASFSDYFGVFIILAYSTSMMIMLGDERKFFLELGDSRTRDMAVLVMRQYKEAYDRGITGGKKHKGWLF